MIPNLKIMQGDWIAELKKLPDRSVHCVATSPPYWGLRQYIKSGKEKQFELGREPTPEEYVSKLVAGFREVRRVLRDDGTLWLNLGDSFCSTAPGTMGDPLRDEGMFRNHGSGAKLARQKFRPATPSGLKPKDLCGIPWRVAFALQADGWYLRQSMQWVKRNSMPESCQDRPVMSCETIFLLAKSSQYFYDAEAIRLPASMALSKQVREGYNGHTTKAFGQNGVQNASDVKSRIINRYRDKQRGHSRRHDGFNDRWDRMEKEGQCSGWRSCRNSDWFFESIGGMLLDQNDDPLAFLVNPSPYSGSHFATFPPNLVLPMILAGTSAKGCCPKCLAPWARTVERAKHGKVDYNGKHSNTDKQSAGRNILASVRFARQNGGDHDNPFRSPITTGWHATCKCRGTVPIPCTVLDPFGGSGTTGKVAIQEGRSAILIELNPEYIKLIQQRTQVTPPLFPV